VINIFFFLFRLASSFPDHFVIRSYSSFQNTHTHTHTHTKQHVRPQGNILESFVQIGTNWCKDSGIYEFTLGATGDVVRARYTFIYVYEDGQWKIAHHHSSQMPENLQPKKTNVNILTDKEVRNLFNLWNDALATLDPTKVAARYAKEAILLPTVSDEPRSTQERITEYFGK
jgi:hypothetical protein